MSEYVICKSCGYVMKKDRLKDHCPACGVPARMFEDYDDRLSATRRLILSLDMHPVLVHFPVAFSVAALFLLILSLLVNGELQNHLKSAVLVLTFCLPFVTVIAFLAGFFDGYIRFRRVTTEILTKKMVMGLVFISLSLTAFILTQIQTLASTVTVYLLIAIYGGCFICNVLLGLLGKSLLNAKFPG